MVVSPSLRLCSGNGAAAVSHAGTGSVQSAAYLRQQVQPAANGPEARHRPATYCRGSIRGVACTATARCRARDRRRGHNQGEACRRRCRCDHTAQAVRAATIRRLFHYPVGAARDTRRSRTRDGLAIARAGRRRGGRRGRLGRVARPGQGTRLRLTGGRRPGAGHRAPQHRIVGTRRWGRWRVLRGAARR